MTDKPRPPAKPAPLPPSMIEDYTPPDAYGTLKTRLLVALSWLKGPALCACAFVLACGAVRGCA